MGCSNSLLSPSFPCEKGRSSVQVRANSPYFCAVCFSEHSSTDRVCHLIETSLWDFHWDYFCRSSCVMLTSEMKLVNAVTLFCHHFCVLFNFWRIQNPQHEVYKLSSVTSEDVQHHVNLRKPLMRLQTETITRDYGLPSLSTPELSVDMSQWNSMGFFSTFTGKVTGHLV